MADPELLAPLTVSPFAFRDASRLARLDRIALLLVALLAVELLELLRVDALYLLLAGVAVFVFGFAYLWGRSVVGLLSGEGV
ncbi:hypothetical protein M0R89_07745 [Halorussus limi]|uniref:Uncharacterized protein n=1 Tax=Halorussus limi TaxID=2938695 RepID=A0A8U0HXS3_9EURY|nr:hypothetical protein [Halorussus limi]UPV75942.1 hypothetical protein M0R89_07745 [Halorussus limi]